jgi:hypothetical protein
MKNKAVLHGANVQQVTRKNIRMEIFLHTKQKEERRGIA